MDWKLGRLIAATACIGLGGCAVGHAIAKGPNGRPMFHIEAGSPTAAYNKASASCPSGYDIVNNAQQGVFTLLDVECK
jgi:hypothetical protein